MAQSSWPGPGPATVTEHQHELLWSSYYNSGLVGTPDLAPLAFADSTGLQVKIRPNRYAVVRGQVWTSGPTEFTVPISANNSGATRVDLVVLRLDRSTWNVTAQVVEGTPGGGEPTIQQETGDSGAWDLIVAVVTVPTGTATNITASMVSGTPFYLGPQLILSDVGAHPGQNSPPYWFRYAPNEDRLEFRRAGGGVTLWADSGEVILSDSSSAWEMHSTCVIRRIGSLVQLRYPGVSRTAGTLSANNESTLPGRIPASMRDPSRDQNFTVRTTSHAAGRVTIVRGNASQHAGRIRLVTHAGINNGWNVSAFTATWMVP